MFTRSNLEFDLEVKNVAKYLLNIIMFNIIK